MKRRIHNTLIRTQITRIDNNSRCVFASIIMQWQIFSKLYKAFCKLSVIRVSIFQLYTNFCFVFVCLGFCFFNCFVGVKVFNYLFCIIFQVSVCSWCLREQSLPYKVYNIPYSIHFRMMELGTFWQKKWNNFFCQNVPSSIIRKCILYGILYTFMEVTVDFLPYMVETVGGKKGKTWRNEVDTKTVKITTSEIHISILKRNFTIL